MGLTPALVVFDLGGVLIDWDPRPAVAAGVGDAEATRFLNEFDFAGWNRLQDAGRSFAEAVEVSEREHPEWTPHLRSYAENYVRSLVGSHADTVEILEELAAGGRRLWALTNWPAETFVHARERFGFLALFEQVLVSGELGFAKPDPRAFAVLLQRAAMPPAQVFFVDDSPANVAAARACSIDAVLFTGAGALRADLADRGLL